MNNRKKLIEVALRVAGEVPECGKTVVTMMRGSQKGFRSNWLQYWRMAKRSAGTTLECFAPGRYNCVGRGKELC